LELPSGPQNHFSRKFDSVTSGKIGTIQTGKSNRINSIANKTDAIALSDGIGGSAGADGIGRIVFSNTKILWSKP
jgi:hypothetical protein